MLRRRALYAAAVAAACAVAGALAQQPRADDAACLAFDSEADCVGADLQSASCAWITNVTADGDFLNSCRGCSLFSLNRGGCLAHCPTYDAESGFCGVAAPTPQPTPMPVAVDSATRVAQGSIVLSMNVVNFDSSTRAAFESAVAETLGAEHVYLDAVDGETCGDAPLCGNDAAMIDFVADFHNVPLPALAACCPARDTVRTEDCQALNLAGGACRVAGVQEPFCGDVAGGGSSQCAALRTETGRELTELVLDLAFETTGFEVTCCTNCTCYGDPNCISFDGTKASWRLCDGRDTRAGKDCALSKAACLARADHEGRQCAWKADWDSNWQDGSPCQIPAASDKSWLLMYQADSFSFRISQSERGVIRDAEMTTSSGTYTLNASRCLAGAGLDDSWSWSGGAMADAPEFTHDWQRVTVPGIFDVLWYTFDEETGIQQSIRCLGTPNPAKTAYGNYRLNIEALVEPETDYAAERTNLDGFCITNDLLDGEQTEASRASYAEHQAVEAVCSTLDSPFDFTEALALGRMLCGAGLSLNGLDLCFDSFCAAHAFPHTDVDACQTLFADRALDEAFCSVAWAVASARTKCVDNVEEFGFDAEVDDFFTRVALGVGECVDDRADLPVSLGTCQAGVTLQYLAVDGDDDSWTDVLAFPEGTVLCAGGLTFAPEGDDLVLFTRPTRIEQCSQSVECGALEQCQTQAGTAARLRYNWPELLPPSPTTPPPTRAPSAGPAVGTQQPSFRPTVGPSSDEVRPSGSPVQPPSGTPVPSASPSPWPSSSPSPWPSMSPTPAPSAKPTTGYPTRLPTTLAPSAAPTDAPASSAPTLSPSAAPSPWPSHSPTSGPSASPTSSPSTSPSSSAPSSSPSTSPSPWPSRSPTASPSSSAPSRSPSASPSSSAPSGSPTPACTVRCPDNTSPPTPTQGQRVQTGNDGDACAASLVFTAADLAAGGDKFCSCDFEAAGAIADGGSSIMLDAACPALTAAVDTVALETVCQLACYLVDNDSGRCAAWDIDWGNDMCNLYACADAAPVLTADLEFVSGLPCNTGSPAARPTTWTRPGRRQLSSSAASASAASAASAASSASAPASLLWARPAPRRALATRRALEESGREEYTVSFWAVFADATAQSSSMAATASANADAMDAVAQMLAADSSLAALAGRVSVSSLYAGGSYKGFDLRFSDMTFDARTHRSAAFLGEVCGALERTFARKSSLNNVDCGSKLLDFRAHADAQGDLVVLFRVQNVLPGKVNTFLESAAAQRELSRQLRQSSLDDVKVLAAAFPGEEDGGGVTAAAGAAIGIGVVAVLAVGTVVAVRRRRHASGGSSGADEQMWNMVHYFQNAGAKK